MAFSQEFGEWRCVFENIRTDFINGLGGRNSPQTPPFRPPRLEAEAKRQTAKEPEKMSARTLFWPEAGFSLFFV